MNLKEKLLTLEGLIGNTPMIKINMLYKNKPISVYTILEYYNYSGSIKDRMALYILKEAYKENILTKDSIILEATSGNTGISFASLGAFLNLKVEIVMPEWMSDERKRLLKAFNSKLTLISKEDGGFIECVALTKEIAKKNNKYFLPAQFENNNNVLAHYYSTGPEILASLNRYKLNPDIFIAGVGTGGTVMGIGKFLKEQNNNLKIHPLEPQNSPTLSTGISHGEHRIQGISDEFIPDILKLEKLDSIVQVDDGDAIVMSQMLSKYLGLGVGISSGANLIGAIKLASKDINENKIVITVFPDDNKKYLTTDLSKEQKIEEDFISKDIQLLDFFTL